MTTYIMLFVLICAGPNDCESFEPMSWDVTAEAIKECEG